MIYIENIQTAAYATVIGIIIGIVLTAIIITITNQSNKKGG